MDFLSVFQTAAFVLADSSSDGDNDAGAVKIFILFILALFWFHRSWRRWKIATIMADTPTSPPSAVPVGRAETTGMVAIPEDLSPVGRTQPCAWYEARLEKFVRGDRSSRWDQVWAASSTQIFLLTDAYGHVEVDPTNAEKHLPKTVVSDHELNFSLVTLATYAKVPAPVYSTTSYHISRIRDNISSYSGEWRLVERFIPLDDQTVTVYGPTSPSAPGSSSPRFDTLTTPPKKFGWSISRSNPANTVHIFAGDARQATRATSLKAWVGLVLAPLAMGLCLYIMALVLELIGALPMAWALELTPSLIGALPVALAYFMVLVRSLLNVYNRLAAAVNQVEAAWSMVDVALARRSSLLPQLATLVADALHYERTLQSALAEARWDAGQSRRSLDPTAVGSTMDSNLYQNLIAVLEAYPKLATAQNALDLQAAISQSENQIAGARTGYNDAVEIARTKLESFPSSLFASRFADRRAALWTC